MINKGNREVVGNAEGAAKVKVVVAADGFTHVAAISATEATLFSGASTGIFTGTPMTGLTEGNLFLVDGTATVCGNKQDGFSYAQFEDMRWSKSKAFLPTAFDSYYVKDNDVGGVILTGAASGSIRAQSAVRDELDLDATVATNVMGLGRVRARTAGAIDAEGRKLVVWYGSDNAIWAALAEPNAAEYDKAVRVMNLPVGFLKMNTLSADFDADSNPVVQGAFESLGDTAASTKTTLFRVNGTAQGELDFGKLDLIEMNSQPSSLKCYIDYEANGHYALIDSLDKSVKFISGRQTGWTAPVTAIPTPIDKIDITGNGVGDLALTALDRADKNFNLLVKAVGDTNWTSTQNFASSDAPVIAFDTYLDDAKNITLAAVDEQRKVSVTRASIS